MLNALDATVDTMLDGPDRARMSRHESSSVVRTFYHRLDLSGRELEVLQLIRRGCHAAWAHDLNEVCATADFLSHSCHALRDAATQAA